MSERARADRRLAWLIVAMSAAVTLALLAALAIWGFGQASRAMQRQRRAQIAERQALDRAAAADARLQRFDVVQPAASTPAPPDTARPVSRPAGWLDADDYPGGAQRRGEEGRVRVTLAIDRAGRPTGCSVTRSSGSPSLDNGTCAAMMRKGRFEPAPDGPMVRRWTSPTVRWVLPR